MKSASKILSLAAVLSIILFGLTQLSHADVDLANANPIQIENQQPGTSDWLVGTTGYSVSDDIAKQIKGYASAPSVNKGQPIAFHITVSPVQTYTIDVYRMGWYNGNRARLMLQSGSLSGTAQLACPQDATTGLTECQWTPSYSLTVPLSWTSGIYLARLTNAQHFQNYIIFAVRDDGRAADFLYQQPVTTYQAYNNYPNDGATGKSLYDFNSSGGNTIVGSKRAVKVSFNRPYAKNNGSGDFDNFYSYWTWEIYLIGWLERMGYDMTYATSVDMQANPARLLNFKGFLSAGHDEYWSKEMFDAAETARDRGVNLAFFGSNAVDFQIRYEPDSAGTANRTIISYQNAAIDPNPNPALKTLRFTQVGRTQQTLLGVEYTTFKTAVPTQPLLITNTTQPSTTWVFAGTGLTDGAIVPNLIGYEIDTFLPDRLVPISTTFAILGHSPFLDQYSATVPSNAVIYQAPSGAWVFTSGTTSWSFALDATDRIDARIQRMTKNILDRFAEGNPPEPLPPTPTPTASPSPTPSPTPPAATCSQEVVAITPRIAIPDNNTTFSCVDLIAPNIGSINTLTLQVGISHTFASDLVLQLRSPDGKALTLMNRVSRPALQFGSPADLWSIYPIVFASLGTDAEKMGLTLGTSNVICRDDNQCAYIANPDGDSDSTISSISGFAGSPSLGTWKLCVADAGNGDTGSLDTAALNLICRATTVQRLVYLPIIQK